jgi:hypothetical protein
MRTQQEQAKQHMAMSAASTVEVQIQQNRAECWLYAWDRDRAQLRLTGRQPACADLPADLATLRLEQQVEVPVYVLSPMSLAPGTVVTVRVLGAFHTSIPSTTGSNAFPLAGWTLLAVPDIVERVSIDETRASLSFAQQEAVRHHIQEQQGVADDELMLCSAATVAEHLREARVWFKRARRTSPRGSRQITREGDEPVVAWRAVEGLTPEQRAQMAQAKTIDQFAPLLEAEQLIRFVPSRFQQTLERVLLDDERLLVFLERPLLRRRTGLLGMQQYRANAGLLLVTDRQVLWLRDFFSPGASFFPEGYIARSIPLDRLVDVALVPAGIPSLSVGSPLEEDTSPYVRLVLTAESRVGQERCEVAFPADKGNEQALNRVLTVLRAFVPLIGPQERHLRRLPVIEPWIPQGTEARRLAGLGGVVVDSAKRCLEQHLSETLRASGEELLVATTVPALEEHHSPTRLVALTRTAVFTFDALSEKGHGRRKAPQEFSVQAHRYELAQVSSAQLSYSLLGSSLRLFLPQPQGRAQEVMIPFQSPAIAWFLPLFTRLRLALTTPLPQFPPAEKPLFQTQEVLFP